MNMPVYLFLKFNEAQNAYSNLWNYFLTNTGNFPYPVAAFPGSYPAGAYNLDCTGACLFDFPGSYLGAGSYSITAYLVDSPSSIVMDPSGTVTIVGNGTSNSMDLSIQEVGTTCEDAVYAQQNPCLCDLDYANAHPQECSVNSTTIVGTYNVSGLHTSGNSSSGTWIFAADGSFSWDETQPDGHRYLNNGVWSLSGDSLAYKYLETTKWNPFGEQQYHCSTTVANWPNGTCDAGSTQSTYPFGDGSGSVQGTAQHFTITQTNNWVLTFTRN
jgi:hypothetical protein